MIYTLSWTKLHKMDEHLREQIIPVRISLGLPRFMKGANKFPQIPQLAPYGDLFYERQRDVFKERYWERLDEIGVDKVRELLDEVQAQYPDKAMTLMCFEHDPADCHRGDFAIWWERETGEEIPEFDGQQTLV